MKVDVLIAEIGSTTTVINAFNNIDGEMPIFIGQGQAATTVDLDDVNIGLLNAIDNLKTNLNVETIEYNELLATSSAAGGLKISVHGLVYEMTAKAAKEAALGAGSNITMITAGKMSELDLKKLAHTPPNIILVAGGVDYGEKETALYNITKIFELDLEIPVIYCGNIAIHDDVKFIAELQNKSHLLTFTENVYPGIDVLNVEPVRKIIHDTFEKHITKAKGMSKIRQSVKSNIMPTPGAVMLGAKLLKEELGDLVVIDVGGATTDIHSVTTGSPDISKILVNPEPEAKRTVEGDLGLYVSARNVYEIIDKELVATNMNIDLDKLDELMENIKPIPTTAIEKSFAWWLCNYASETSIKRHAGDYRNLYTISGSKRVADGKDLTNIKFVILTGGALTRLPNTKDMIADIIVKNSGLKLLPTNKVEILIDQDYILASAGILSVVNKEAAIKLLRKSLCIQE